MNGDTPALTEELEDIALLLAEQCMTLGAQMETHPLSAEQLLPLEEEYARLAMACDLYRHGELASLAAWGERNIRAMAALPVDAQRRLLDTGLPYQWVELCAAYLGSPGDGSLLAELKNTLQHPDWPEPFPADHMEALLTELCAPDDTTTRHDETPETHPVPEPAAGYPLHWSEDVHPELLDAFFIEAPEQTARLADLLRKIAASDTPVDEETHRTATRLAHTLKGASSVVGIAPVTDLTHLLEDILNFSSEAPLPETLREHMSAAADCLEGLFDALQDKGAAPDNYLALSHALEQWREQLLEEAESEDDATPEAPRKARAPAKHVRSSEPNLLVPVSLIDRLLNLVEEMATTTGRALAELESTLGYNLQSQEQDSRARRTLAEFGALVDESLALGKAEVGSESDADSPFDSLEMDRYNAVHGANNAMEEALADSREITLASARHLRHMNDILHDQNRVREEIGATLLRTRLIPIKTLVPRLERIVRETCRSTGKQAELVVNDNQLALDTDIINSLAEPLLHLLRNAVDHGIEPAAIRTASGKPEIGRITLNCTRSGNRVHLELEDDGAGMDIDGIRRQALTRGLIDDADALDEEATLALVMQSGFSTREEVSTVSGRGVGMDVVQASIQRLQGNIRIESDAGAGSRIHLRVPTTLVSVNAVVVRVSGHAFAIPGDSISQLLYIEDEPLRLGRWPEELADYHRGAECWYYAYQDDELAIEPLAALLGLPSPDIAQPAGSTMVLFEEADGARHLFQIDEVVQTRNILLKPLAPYLGNVPGVIGACLLANGDVAPVLDIKRLLDYRREGFDPEQHARMQAPPAPAEAPAEILIVDDSLSNRKALSLMIEQLGYTPITAIDGLDALEHLDESLPALILTDLEMPRMNGIELTYALRQQQETSEIPIVMITSRSSRKHRQQAEDAGVDDYLTKPVDSDTLTDCVKQWVENEAPA